MHAVAATGTATNPIDATIDCCDSFKSKFFVVDDWHYGDVHDHEHVAGMVASAE
jgi:hypothetical protein